MVNFTEKEIDTLRWLIRSERQVQYMIPDSTMLPELEDLYDKVSSLLPTQSIGEAKEILNSNPISHTKRIGVIADD